MHFNASRGSADRSGGAIPRIGGLLVAAVVLTAACGEDTTTPAVPQEILGAPTAVGNGTARTFALVDGGKPVSLGIELTDAALDGLPSTPTEWILPLPVGFSAPPWDHAALNWNPQGHPPPGIYDAPHFDFHFYTITQAEQAAVQGGPDTVAVPAADVPPDYVPDPVAIPDMGVHWTDSMAPEFHGTPFDRTFIYGFYHGEMAFVEPMVTRAYLQTHPDASMTVKQPQAFQEPGLYPRDYSVRFDAATSTLRISLDSLASR